MLSSFNGECCINPGVCLDITPWFFFTGFCTATARNRGQNMVE